VGDCGLGVEVVEGVGEVSRGTLDDIRWGDSENEGHGEVEYSEWWLLRLGDWWR